MPKTRKAAKVAYTLLNAEDHATDYALLDAVRDAYHDDITGAHVALAFCNSWKADVDGIQTLGKCKRAASLDRELHAWDFVILLNEDFWRHELTTNQQREALLDHELCHAAVTEDPDTGDPKRDERGRIVYRIRKHDLEEFACIPERHGLWKRDLERFAQAIRRADQQPKLPMDPADAQPAVH